jgi:DNA repair exonuclease SbcCD ATPase subunit
MDKLKTLQTDLKTAQDALTALQDELPQFHALLTDNEGDAQRLKSERASLDAQSQARGRVNVAREMLEQHRSDIATARAEVSRLEASERRELNLIEMAEHAKTAHEHRAAVNKVVMDAVEALQHAAQSIIREWSAFDMAKDAFINAGADELGTLQWCNDPESMGLRGDKINSLETRVQSVLEAVKERGADVSTLLEGNVVSIKYRSYGTLPSEGLAMLVWATVLAHKDVPGSLKLVAPKPRQPISVQYVDALPDTKYNL